MEMYLAVDPVAIQGFALDLRLASAAFADIGYDLSFAEIMADLATGVHGQLGEAEVILSASSAALLAANDLLDDFRIDVDRFSPDLPSSGIATAASGAAAAGISKPRPEHHPLGLFRVDRPENHPLAESAAGWAPLEPFQDTGTRELSFGTTRREHWIDKTRATPIRVKEWRTWASEHGEGGLAGVALLAGYLSLEDKGVNHDVVGRGHQLAGDNAQRTIVETEARRQYLDVELLAIRNGWSGERRIEAHLKQIDSLTSRGENLGYPDSSENTRQVAIAYRLLLAHHQDGELLPVLSQEEVDLAVSLGADGENEVVMGPGTEILSLATALSTVSDTALISGLRALSSMADAAVLLGSLVHGDEATFREKTSDVVTAKAIYAAARWLVPRVVAGPAVTIALLVIALTQIGPEGEVRPSGAPRVGYVDELGRVVSNSHCNNAAGFTDTVACN